MNKFSIDQLRADVAHHFPRFHVEHYRTADQFDNLINFMIAALIGIDAYELMSARHSTYKYYNQAYPRIADQDTGHTIWLG